MPVLPQRGHLLGCSGDKRVPPRTSPTRGDITSSDKTPRTPATPSQLVRAPGLLPPSASTEHVPSTNHSLTKVDPLAAARAHVGLPGEGGDAGGCETEGRERGTPHPAPSRVPRAPLLTFAGSLGRSSVHFPLLHPGWVLNGPRCTLPLNLRLLIDVRPGTADVHPCSEAEAAAAQGSPSPPSPISPPPGPYPCWVSTVLQSQLPPHPGFMWLCLGRGSNSTFCSNWSLLFVIYK